MVDLTSMDPSHEKGAARAPSPHEGGRSRLKWWLEVTGAFVTILGISIATLVSGGYRSIHNHFWPPPPSVTVHSDFDPWQSPNAFEAANYALTSRLTASCQDPSRAHYAPNTHRCSLTNDKIEDPCFDPPPGEGYPVGRVVACVDAPWDKVTFVRLIGPENQPSGTVGLGQKDGLAALWAFRLNNGDQCLHYPEGTAEYIDANPVIYLCSHGRVTSVDTKGQLWRAEYFGNGDTQSQLIPITEAWS